YEQLCKTHADFVVSCGSSVAPINCIFSYETSARSIAILKPSILSLKKFDMVILPRHDTPPERDNIVVTEGSLNVIDKEYLSEQSRQLTNRYPNFQVNKRDKLGLLLGGNTKNYCLSSKAMDTVLSEIKRVAQDLGLEMLATTSRRTPREIDELIKKELKAFPPCKLLVIANENNIPEAVGSILNFSKIVIVSSDSISMISEAASSGKYVIVFNGSNIAPNRRHEKFLTSLSQRKYIYWIDDVHSIASTIKDIYRAQPKVKTLNDFETVRKALHKIL
ncbi:ELM1/GtrOC1 family putative glycosyltransferase, partial [Candidatus Omnitrophota bacterium]